MYHRACQLSVAHSHCADGANLLRLVMGSSFLVPWPHNVEFQCDIPGTAIADLPRSKVRSRHDNCSSAADWMKKSTVGWSDNMIVSRSSVSGRSYAPVSFCRGCAILSQGTWQAVLSSLRFPQPVSNEPL